MAYEIQYILSLVTAVIEQLFFTGLIFGWSSINYVLKKEGYMSGLCNEDHSLSELSGQDEATANSTTSNRTFSTASIPVNVSLSTPLTIEYQYPTCRFQDEAINLIFTIASVALSFSTLPNGYVYDRFGTWVSRSIAILLVTGGAVLVSVSTVQTSEFLYPAMCCFSVGGILLLVTNMQLGNLFGHARSSVITLMNGALDSSSFVFLLVKLAYDSGIAFSTIFQFIACCTVFPWLRTLLFMPRMHIPYPLPKGRFRYGLQDCKPVNTEQSAEKVAMQMKSDDEAETTVKTNTIEHTSFWTYAKTGKFWMNLMHMSLLQLRNYFFLGTFYTWMKNMLPPDSTELKGFVTVFGVCQFFGVVAAPLNGLLMDSAIRRLRRSCDNFSVVSARAVSFSAFTTSSLGVLFSLVLLIPSAKLQYLSFVLQVVFRSFLYGGNASFIALLFPSEHFGKLYGLTMTLGGVVALFQFPLFSLVLWVFYEDFLVINIIFVIVCVLTYAHPISLYMSSKKQEKLHQSSDAEKQVLSSDVA